jgi:hypothetical protein
MKIYHSNPKSNYTILPIDACRDVRLSYTARGILAEMLSYEQGRDINADELSRQARQDRGDRYGEGRQAIRAAFAELEAAGYLRRRRLHSASGMFATILELTDTPNLWATAPRDDAAQDPPEHGQPPFVYVIGEKPSGVVKIGTTESLESRLRQIQNASPRDLRVLWCYGGDWRLESYLHKQYEDRHVRGEWFDFADEDPVRFVSESTALYYRMPIGSCGSWLSSR